MCTPYLLYTRTLSLSLLHNTHRNNNNFIWLHIELTKLGDNVKVSELGDWVRGAKGDNTANLRTSLPTDQEVSVRIIEAPVCHGCVAGVDVYRQPIAALRVPRAAQRGQTVHPVRLFVFSGNIEWHPSKLYTQGKAFSTSYATMLLVNT